MRSRSRILAAVLALCVVGRGAYALYLVHVHAVVSNSGDAPSYLGPARELLHHWRFDTWHPRGQPEFLRTPGYPAFVAAVWRVFGETNSAVLLVQVVLSALTVYLVYLLASRMWSAPIGLLAAVLTALDPLQNATSATLLTECLSALALTGLALVGYLVFATDKPRLWLLAMLGFVLAAATLLRPVTYYFPLLVVGLLVLKYARRRDRRGDLVKMTAAFLVPLVIFLGGWQFRNHERVDSWRISGIEAKNLYKYRAAGAIARSSGISLSTAQRELNRKFGALGTERQGPYYNRMYHAGMHILAAHPGATFMGAVSGLWSEVFSVRDKFFEYLRMKPASGAVDVAALTLLLAFYALFAYGIVLVVRERKNLLAHLFVVSIAGYILLASAGPEALGGRGERFRAPIMPILILYAARGAYALYTATRTRTVAATEPENADAIAP
jgi:4-amino-4-deoxy-L-arabinose transferase-like glycosyltransferase